MAGETSHEAVLVNEHAIFNEFRNSLLPLNTVNRSLIEEKNDLFYIFDISAGQVLVTRTSSFKHPNVNQRYQKYMPKIKIVGEPLLLRVSDNNEEVAVATEFNVYVMHLPFVWTACMMLPTVSNESESDVWVVTQPLPSIVEMCNEFLYKVLQVKWFPGKPSHLLILYNDNNLRHIDTHKKITMQTVPLGCQSPLLQSPLGYVVDFDVTPLRKKEGEKYAAVQSYQVISLTISGDIQCVYLKMQRSTHLGPITAASADKPALRKGTASVLVLPCEPPVIVVVTNYGKIYHYLLLDDPKEPDDILSDRGKICHRLEEFNMYFQMLPLKKQTTGPLFLIRDQATLSRYFIISDASIHAVMVPATLIVDRFPQLLDGEEQDIEEFKSVVKEEAGGILRCILSTLMSGQKTIRPLFGVGLIAGPQITCQIIALLADAEAISLSLINQFPPAEFYRINKNGRNKSFYHALIDLLSGPEATKLPALKYGQDVRMTSKEKLEFVQRYIEFFTQEYLLKHEIMKTAIRNRIFFMNTLKEMQRNQVLELVREKEILKTNAEIIAEKYEDSCERFVDFKRRLAQLLLKVEVAPVTLTEVRMREELPALKQKVDFIEKVLCCCQTMDTLITNLRQRPLQSQTYDEAIGGLHPQSYHMTETNNKAINTFLNVKRGDIKELKEKLWKMKDLLKNQSVSS